MHMVHLCSVWIGLFKLNVTCCLILKPTPPEPEVAPPVKAEPENIAPVAPPPAEDVDETWEEKEDKLDAENIKPQSPTPTSPTEQKYQYKAGNEW